MKLTPLDIQQQQFKTAIWGFDSKEVDAFLELIAGEYERLVRENNSVRDQLRLREAEIEEYRKREQTLKETMVTATRMSDDIRENAKREADIVVARAEAQGEQIVQNAHNRLVRVLEDLDELKRQRAQLSASLRSVIESHRELLEAMSERTEAVHTDAFNVVRHIDRSSVRSREGKEVKERPLRNPKESLTERK